MSYSTRPHSMQLNADAGEWSYHPSAAQRPSRRDEVHPEEFIPIWDVYYANQEAVEEYAPEEEEDDGVFISPSGIPWKIVEGEEDHEPGYAIFMGQQLSDEWHRVRSGRITASNVSAVAASWKPTKAKRATAAQLDSLASKIAISKRTETEFMTPELMHGLLSESVARKWYENTYNTKTHEIGFVYPLESRTALRIAEKAGIRGPGTADKPGRFARLGASPDSLVGEDGMLEIKCPLHGIYGPLLKRRQAIRSGKNVPPAYKAILPKHYDQMQMSMGIMRRKWCEYIVAAIPPTASIRRELEKAGKDMSRVAKAPDYYIERIDFNQGHYEALVTKATAFAGTYLDHLPLETIDGLYTP